MKQMLPVLLIMIVLLYALYLSDESKKTKATINTIEKSVNPRYTEHIELHHEHHLKEELKQIGTSHYAKEYIVNVINHGSEQLDSRGGDMEGGFASPTDAGKIACYVLEFSGKKCKIPYEKNAAMFYTSNCGGCHGNDGKGLNGTYPDLTRKKLLGIEKREILLNTSIKK